MERIKGVIIDSISFFFFFFLLACLCGNPFCVGTLEARYSIYDWDVCHLPNFDVQKKCSSFVCTRLF